MESWAGPGYKDTALLLWNIMTEPNTQYLWSLLWSLLAAMTLKRCYKEIKTGAEIFSVLCKII